MPNHVYHQLSVNGPIDDVSRFKQLMITAEQKAEENIQCFNLDQVIPMPPILERVIASSSRGPNGRSWLFKEGVEGFDRYKDENHIEATEEEEAEIVATGYSSWYDWRIAHWGTKWNSYEFGELVDQATYQFSFNTAWSTPHPVLDTLPILFPNLNFGIAWLDEGACHAGKGNFGSGTTTLSSEQLYIPPEDSEFYVPPEEEPYYPGDPYENPDVMTRMLSNFTCEDVAAASDENGFYPISATFYSDDIPLSDDELRWIRKQADRLQGPISEKDYLVT